MAADIYDIGAWRLSFHLVKLLKFLKRGSLIKWNQYERLRKLGLQSYKATNFVT